MTAIPSARAKDSHLVQAAILYIVKACADRDTQAIRQIGITEDQIARLTKLTAQDLLANADLAGAPVAVQIDAPAFDAWLSAVENARKTEELVMRCVSAEAPYNMMAYFFHISTRQYKKLCDFAGKKCQMGRTPRARPDENVAIYNHIAEHEGDITAETILEIAERCRADVRVVWKEMEPVLAHGIDAYQVA